jgi:general secretion pathway protein H
MASAGVTLSLRDGKEVQLEREAERLVALLEAARARSQLSGVPVQWRLEEAGFRFDGLDAAQLPKQWLDPDTSASPGATLLLGPEPIIGAQALTLQSRSRPGALRQTACARLRCSPPRHDGRSPPWFHPG